MPGLTVPVGSVEIEEKISPFANRKRLKGSGGSGARE